MTELPLWVHGLPLAGYLGLIVVLFVRLVPAAWSATSARPSYGAPRPWQLTEQSKDRLVHGQLKGVTRKHIVLARDDGTMARVPLDTLTVEDRAYVRARSADRYVAGSVLFLALAGVSLAATWTYMLQYFALSAYDHASRTVRPHLMKNPLAAFQLIARPSAKHWSPFLWLRDVSLFDEAWTYVCATPARWLLSSQLTLFAVVVSTPLLSTTELQLPRRLSLLVLGQIVAISVATALFMRLPSRPATHVSPLLWPSLIVATFATGLTPYTVDTARFLPTLLGLHALLFLPLLPWRLPRHRVHLDKLYITLAFLSTLVHLAALFPDGRLLPLKETVAAFFAHPAQGSIGSDAVMCAVIWTAYVALGIGWPLALASAAAVPVLGLAGSATAVLAWRERATRAQREVEALKVD